MSKTKKIWLTIGLSVLVGVSLWLLFDNILALIEHIEQLNPNKWGTEADVGMRHFYLTYKQNAPMLIIKNVFFITLAIINIIIYPQIIIKNIKR